MKFLFIVQGEGRGHLSQAIALEHILISAGHEICCVMVGTSGYREIPEYFKKRINTTVLEFKSPNFKKSLDNKGINISISLIINSFIAKIFIKSTRIIHQTISYYSPDVVINFYEPLAGLAYRIHKIKTPHVCIGHHFLTEHQNFPLPANMKISKRLLLFLNKLTSYGAQKVLALSFRSMPPFQKKKNFIVAPPLLRKEILNARPVNENFIMGYMLNHGFYKDVLNWHKENSEEKAVFFWDNSQAEKILRINENLVFYQLDDQMFIDKLTCCRGFISNAGFESICEAMYLQKPFVIVPVHNHFEQLCNAFDASLSDSGMMTNQYNPQCLTRLIQTDKEKIKEDETTRTWFLHANDFFLEQITNI